MTIFRRDFWWWPALNHFQPTFGIAPCQLQVWVTLLQSDSLQATWFIYKKKQNNNKKLQQQCCTSWCHKQYDIKCTTFIVLIHNSPCWQVYSRAWGGKSGGQRRGHRLEKAHGRQPNDDDDNNNNDNNTGGYGTVRTWEGPQAGSSYHVSIILGHERRQLHLRGRGSRDRLLKRQQTSPVDQTADQKIMLRCF